MPDFTLNPQQEEELNGFVLEMEQDNLPDDEIKKVVDNYITKKSGESYVKPEGVLGVDTDIEETEFGPVEGTEEQVAQADSDYEESIKADPLEETYRKIVKLTPEEEEKVIADATASRKKLYDSFAGARGEDVWRVLGSDEDYREYTDYLRTGEVIPNELDVSTGRQGVTDFKERQFLTSLNEKDQERFMDIAANSKARLKSSSKKLSKYAPLVDSKVKIIEPLQKQAEELRILIDHKTFIGEDPSKEIEARKGLLEKIKGETDGFGDLFKQYLEANKNTIDDSQIADAFSRTYSIVKAIEQPFAELESDLGILAADLFIGKYEPENSGFRKLKKAKLEEREQEELFRTHKLRKPISIENIDNVAAFGMYAGDALINNAPSVLISAAGSLSGLPYLAYPLFFGMGAGSKLSQHELVKKGGKEEIKRIDKLLETATDKDQIALLSKEKRNINNTLTTPEWKKWLTVAGYGTAELVFEKYGTMKIFDNIRDAAKLAGKANLKKGFKNFSNQFAQEATKKVLPFVQGFTIESLTEGATTLTQNWLDINVIGEEKALDEGLSDSLLQGGIIGGVIQSGGSVASTLVNAVADQGIKAKIRASNKKVNAILEQLHENPDITPEVQADLIFDLINEVRSISALETETIGKLNDLTPKEQRDLVYAQHRIDVLNAQEIGIQESSISDELKESQLLRVESERKEYETEKESIINKTLNSLEREQINDLSTPIEGVNIDDLKAKLEGNVKRLQRDLKKRIFSLKANQSGPEHTFEETEPYRKIISRSKKGIEKIDKFLEAEFEKALGGATGAAKDAAMNKFKEDKRKENKKRKDRAKFTVKVDGKGKIIDVSDSEGNLAPPSDASRAIFDHISAMDLVSGKTIGQKGIYPGEGDIGNAIALDSENPYEIAQQLEIELGYTEEEQNAKGYKEAAIVDNIRITKGDYSHYGDPNTIKDISRAWFSEKSGPLDIQVRELSEELGVEITPQDVIDTINDNPTNPNKYTRKTSQAVHDLRLRFQEITGINPTAKILSKVLKEGANQTEQGFAPDETSKEETRRKFSERKQEFESALKKISDAELEGNIPNTTDESTPKSKTTPQTPAEIKTAKKSLKAAVVKDVNSGKYDIKIKGSNNYTTKNKDAALRVLGGATQRGLEASIESNNGIHSVEIVDPSTPAGKDSKLDDMINHYDDVYNNMPKDGNFYSSVIPLPSARAVLGLLVDALKAVRGLLRAGKSIIEAVKETYGLVAAHLTEKQWGDFIKANIAPKEADRLKYEQNAEEFIYGKEDRKNVRADLDSVETSYYPSPLEISDPKETSVNNAKNRLKKASEDPFFNMSIAIEEIVEGKEIGVPAVRTFLKKLVKEQGADEVTALFGTVLALTKFYDADVLTDEEYDALEDDEVTEEIPHNRALVEFATKFGSIIDPDPIDKNGVFLDTGEANKYYVSLANVLVRIAEKLDIVGIDIGFHTNQQLHIKVLDGNKVNDLITHSINGEPVDNLFYGLYSAGQLPTRTRFRQNGRDIVSNAQESVKKELAVRNESNADIFDALDKYVKVNKVVDVDVLGIQLHPSYQNSDMFTKKDKNLAEAERKFRVLQEQLAFQIGVNQGDAAYNVDHTYGWRYRMHARSLGWNFQSNSKIRSTEKFEERLPLKEQGYYLLNIQITDAYGKGTAKLIKPGDRFNWAVNNRTKGINYLQILENPFSPESVALVNGAKEPTKFLASVWEMGHALQHEGGPENFPSNLKISLDFVASADQHMALILKDPVLLRLTNLSLSQDKFDANIEPAIVAIEGLEPDNSDSARDAEDTVFINKLNKALAAKDNRLKDRNKARDSYIKKATEAERTSLSVVKKLMAEADRATIDYRVKSGNPRPKTRSEVAQDYIDKDEGTVILPTVKEVLEKIIAAEKAFKDSQKVYNSARGKAVRSGARDRDYTKFFGTRERKEDMRTPGKISNMLGGYGAGRARVGKDINSQLGEERLYNGITPDRAKWIADKLVDAADELYESKAELKEFFKIAGKQAADLEISMTWKTLITGATVEMRPSFVKSVPVAIPYSGNNINVLGNKQTKFDGKTRRIFPRVAVGFKDRMKKQKMETAGTANFIHSGDSQTPAYVGLEFGQDVDFVHDDGSTQAANAMGLHIAMRESLVESYFGVNPIELFLKDNPQLTEAKAHYVAVLKPLMGEGDVRDLMYNPSAAGGGTGYTRVSEKGQLDKTDKELAQELLDTLGPLGSAMLEQTNTILIESGESIQSAAAKVNENTKQIGLLGEYYKSDKDC